MVNGNWMAGDFTTQMLIGAAGFPVVYSPITIHYSPLGGIGG
jgi:hypothetical protein